MLALLAKTLTSEQHKRALVDNGMLTILAARLASFVVAEGLVPPSSEAMDSDNNVFSFLPDPAPPFAHYYVVDFAGGRRRLLVTSERRIISLNQANHFTLGNVTGVSLDQEFDPARTKFINHILLQLPAGVVDQLLQRP